MVLPGALVAVAYCQLVVLIFGLILPLPEPALSTVEQLIGSGLCAYYLVYAGCLIAPFHRRATAIALLVLSVAFSIATIYFSIEHPASIGIPLGWVIVDTVVALVAAIAAATRVASEGDEGMTVRERDSRWYTPVLRVGLFTALVGYAYGYVGQAILFLALSWDELRSSWLNLLNPFFDLEILFRQVTSATFWILLVVAFVCFGASNWLSKKIDERTSPPEVAAPEA